MAAVDIGDVETALCNPQLGEGVGRPRLDLLDAAGESRGVGVESALQVRKELLRLGSGLMLLTSLEGIDADKMRARKIIEKEQRRAAFPGADLHDARTLAAIGLEQIRPAREVP